jgi:hypothetical protein
MDAYPRLRSCWWSGISTNGFPAASPANQRPEPGFRLRAALRRSCMDRQVERPWARVDRSFVRLDQPGQSEGELCHYAAI